MSKWKIEYCYNENRKSEVEEFFDHLTIEQFKSVAKELKLLELCGNTQRLPHSRSLGDGIFELRERKYGYRIYYTYAKNKIIILLYAGIKDTQDHDIIKAKYLVNKITKEVSQ